MDFIYLAGILSFAAITVAALNSLASFTSLGSRAHRDDASSSGGGAL